IAAAYGFSQVSFANGPNGTGQTIAIIDAYHDPNIINDLKTFDKAFGISDKDGQGNFALSVTYLTTSGQVTATPPANRAASSQGISLDVEWAHALAPGAHIMLIEAANNNFTSLFNAVQYASTHGASVVSMSWGSTEFSGEQSYDSYFTTSG